MCSEQNRVQLTHSLSEAGDFRCSSSKTPHNPSSTPDVTPNVSGSRSPCPYGTYSSDVRFSEVEASDPSIRGEGVGGESSRPRFCTVDPRIELGAPEEPFRRSLPCRSSSLKRRGAPTVVESQRDYFIRAQWVTILGWSRCGIPSSCEQWGVSKSAPSYMPLRELPVANNSSSDEYDPWRNSMCRRNWMSVLGFTLLWTKT